LIYFYISEVNGNTVAGRYTPAETDRSGLTISCTDTEHSNWKGGNTEKAVAVLTQCEYHENHTTCLHKFIKLCSLYGI